MSSVRCRRLGQQNLERVDAEHQVLAKLARLDHVVQPAMRGADKAHIDCERIVLAHPTNLAAFEHAEQLGLHRLGQLADLVQKHRPAVGHFEQPDAMLVGPRETSFAMAEQLAFDEVLRQRPAIDRHERLIGPQALLVEGSGDEFLAGPGFAEDQHARMCRGHFGDKLADAIHVRRIADQSCRSLDPLEPPLERPILVRQLAFLEHALE